VTNDSLTDSLGLRKILRVSGSSQVHQLEEEMKADKRWVFSQHLNTQAQDPDIGMSNAAVDLAQHSGQKQPSQPDCLLSDSGLVTRELCALWKII
jgi:hypothetical protein